MGMIVGIIGCSSNKRLNDEKGGSCNSTTEIDREKEVHIFA